MNKKLKERTKKAVSDALKITDPVKCNVFFKGFVEGLTPEEKRKVHLFLAEYEPVNALIERISGLYT